MRVTVTQLPEGQAEREGKWHSLVRHVSEKKSDLVLLPEMPFSDWIFRDSFFVQEEWRKSMELHDRWLERIKELAPAAVVGTRPIEKNGGRFNEGFIWDAARGYRSVHLKRYLPNEPGFWEASWYERGPADFSAVTVGGLKLGFLICTEMWFTEHARAYARMGAHLLVCPRATELASGEKWLAGGRAAAVMSGAYFLSANHGGLDRYGQHWGGLGWILDPEDGSVLATTSETAPWITLEIDPARADLAKETYPRYVPE